MQILLVDDDRELVDLLAFALRRAGLEPLPAYDASSALQVFSDKQPDLAVLDVNLGLGNGLDVLKALRQRSQLPIIMLTAFDTEEDKVRGLELGADDYLTKPFSHRELIARIRAQLRRAGMVPDLKPDPAVRLDVGPIVLDTRTHTVTKHGRAGQLDRNRIPPAARAHGARRYRRADRDPAEAGLELCG